METVSIRSIMVNVPAEVIGDKAKLILDMLRFFHETLHDRLEKLLSFRLFFLGTNTWENFNFCWICSLCHI